MKKEKTIPIVICSLYIIYRSLSKIDKSYLIRKSGFAKEANETKKDKIDELIAKRDQTLLEKE